jgi:hypothetical protein
MLFSISNVYSARSAVATANDTIYLPLVTNPASPSPPSGGGSGAGAGTAFWLPFSTQDNGYVGTAGTNVAVDAQGGVHILYTVTLNQDNGHRPAYYLYCPANCSKASQWTRVRLGDNLFDARLQLDAAGHPRAILYVYTGEFVDSYPLTEYQFAMCDSVCTDAQNWSITPIEQVVMYEPNRRDHANHYFALDAQGHPALLFADSNIHRQNGGEYFVACWQDDLAKCANVQNWQETWFSSDILYNPELVFGRDGLPRIALEGLNRNSNFDKLLYFECVDRACAQYNFQPTYEAGAFASYSLRLDHQDRPRLVYFTGEANGPLEKRQLYYSWCNSNCTERSNWSATNLHTQLGHGWSVDLALDQNDHPRFVYKMGDVGPGLAWCNANCESAQALWQARLIENVEILEAIDPINPILSCSISQWSSGFLPQLALNPLGNPLVTFDVKHQYGGTDTRPGHSGEPCPVGDDIPLSRFASVGALAIKPAALVQRTG